MHAFRTLIAILALSLATVSAAPFHPHHNRHKRSTCRTRSVTSSVSTASVSSSSVSATASSTAIATSTAVATSSSSTEKASSTHVSSSTHKSSSTAKASSTSSSKAASSTSGVVSALKKLFPVSSSDSWTTSSDVSDALPLSDSTLGVTKLLSALSHNYVTAPDGVESMQAHYPEGSWTFGHDPEGGFSFYAVGPDGFDLTDAKEATLTYSVLFEDDFDFNMGGKLPGIYGGDSEDVATSCSGGSRRDDCFSARFMFRTDGMGEMYTYLPPSYSANTKVCDVAPKSDCNDVYGASVGRGAFSFKAGTRTTIGQRVKLNDVGEENGELELFVEGKSLWTVTGLVLRDSSAGRMRGIQMQTFFGGSTSEWASPKSQNSYFSDFSIAVTEKL